MIRVFVCNAKNNPLFLSLYTYDSEYFAFIMILSEKAYWKSVS